MTYRTLRQTPSEDVQIVLTSRINDVRRYVNICKDHYRDAATAFDEKRQALADKALDPDTTTEVLRDWYGDMMQHYGELQAWEMFFTNAIGMATTKPDETPVLRDIHIAIGWSYIGRINSMANDDAWSGRSNDDRRKVRDGWTHAWEQFDNMLHLLAAP